MALQPNEQNSWLAPFIHAFQGNEINDLEEAFKNELTIKSEEAKAMHKKRLSYEVAAARIELDNAKQRLLDAKQNFKNLRETLDRKLEEKLPNNRGLLDTIRDAFANLSTEYRLITKADGDLESARRRLRYEADEVLDRSNRVIGLTKALNSHAKITLGREKAYTLEAEMNIVDQDSSSSSGNLPIHHSLFFQDAAFYLTKFVAFSMISHTTHRLLRQFFGAANSNLSFGRPRPSPSDFSCPNQPQTRICPKCGGLEDNWYMPSCR